MRVNFDQIPDRADARPAGSRLLARLYRDIGLAAVASELRLGAEEFSLDLSEAIARGALYLSPEPIAMAS